jgi:hypothetical protein
MTSSGIWLITIVGAVYLGAIVGMVALWRWRRKTRWPFKLEDRLLRGPGEHLRKRIAELDERLMFELIFGFVGILVALSLVADNGRKLFGWTPQQAAWLAVLAAAAVMGVSVWRLRRLWRNRANHYLGWFGERVVGEQLQQATTQGWTVFHDVPCQENGAKFNLDHVAVGPGGVILIETKTRRKGNARPGFDDNKVYFDGRDLVWPWGEDNHGLEQAERNALWLTNWIKAEIGEKIYVTPILALPGWWLELKPARETRLCRVVNPKWLPGLLAKERLVLTPKQVELIRLRLDARCRDVEE